MFFQEGGKMKKTVKNAIKKMVKKQTDSAVKKIVRILVITCLLNIGVAILFKALKD